MKSTKIIFSIILGVAFAWIGYIYATHTADMLPHYFPGYAATLARVHTKHSLVAFIVAALFFIYAWFVSGKDKTASEQK